jgi:hypothetical protein
MGAPGANAANIVIATEQHRVKREHAEKASAAKAKRLSIPE